MQKAIEIAIENGWNPKPNYFWLEGVYNWGVRFGGDDGDREDFRNETILLDPDFWKAFLKGLAHKNGGIPVERNGASFAQHDFIDHLAKGGDINEYFEELCKEK